MAKHSAEKIELTPFDDLFQTDESREDLQKERLTEIPLSAIRDFPEHPYQVKDDENMMELVESVKTYGLLQPVLVRPLEDGTYEMVSGHRRKRAFELAGIEKIPARVKELSRDDAILMMVDSNLQRDEILPSEKAFAYKMRLDAMTRQGKRTDLTSAPVEQKLKNKTSRELLAESVGESHAQIQRYIRLTELIPELLELVDEKRIALRPAVEISYLSPEAQKWLYEAIGFADATPSHAQTIKMRKFFEEGKLTQEVVESIMEEEKPNQRVKPAFKDKRIMNLIPRTLAPEQQSDYVVKALQYYNRFLERKKEMGR
ncbi:MAG: ParB/RepB/Spo0J family partition protein [Clostridia bacterium]|nr:ParB/RepB/Spo0J family partition protein [Clostridia bacterium]